MEDAVVVEVKAVAAVSPLHRAQVITYLKLTGCRLGLLINFNVPVLCCGIRLLLHPDVACALKNAQSTLPDITRSAD